MERVALGADVTMSRIVYGMWRLADDSDTSDLYDIQGHVIRSHGHRRDQHARLEVLGIRRGTTMVPRASEWTPRERTPAER